MYLKRNVFFIKIFVKIDHEIFVKLADADIGYQYKGQSENVWQFNVIVHLKKKKDWKSWAKIALRYIWSFNKHFVLIYFLFADFGPIEIPPAPESVASYEVNGPRLMISKIVNENFKSYAGVQTLGPFHKVWGLIVLSAECMELFIH